MKLNYDKTQIANFIKNHRLEYKIKKYMLVVTEPGTCMFIVDYIRVDTLDRAYELALSLEKYKEHTADLLFSFTDNAFYTNQFVSLDDISLILRENTYSDALHILRMITRE